MMSSLRTATCVLVVLAVAGRVIAQEKTADQSGQQSQQPGEPLPFHFEPGAKLEDIAATRQTGAEAMTSSGPSFSSRLALPAASGSSQAMAAFSGK